MRTQSVSILSLTLYVALSVGTVTAVSAADMPDSVAATVETPVAQPTGRQNVCGIVRDSNGDALIGAAVSVREDARLSAITDIDGRFCIPNAPERCNLTISYVNCEPAHIEVVPGKDEYAVTLQDRAEQLEEVVVVGYASQRKVDLTGSVSSIGSKAPPTAR